MFVYDINAINRVSLQSMYRKQNICQILQVDIYIDNASRFYVLFIPLPCCFLHNTQTIIFPSLSFLRDYYAFPHESYFTCTVLHAGLEVFFNLAFIIEELWVMSTARHIDGRCGYLWYYYND